MTDLVERLRDYSLFERGDDMDIWRNCLDAANEIERLEAALDACADYGDKQVAEIERLEAELRRAKMLAMKGRTVHGGWPDVEGSGDELNFIKAFWRAEPSCLNLKCNADCNPMTAHCGRGA